MATLHYDNGQPANGRKAMLATTSYGSPDDSYTFSLQNSREALAQAGVPTAYLLLQGNCHVDDARNRVVQEFLLSDCTELIWLDADVSWHPSQLVRLCSYAVDVVGGVYPYRREDKLGEMPVRLIPGAVEQNGLVEVEGLPTGFLRIQRHVIETLVRDCESFDGNNGNKTHIPLLFQRTLIDGTRWGGDLNFCNLWRATGGKIYCDPELVLGHTAKIVLRDSLSALMRRRQRATLRHVVEKIRAGTDSLTDYAEARTYMANDYTAPPELLALAVGMARKAKAPIIETGSGLTTILMAAATEQTVYCLEHSELYAQHLREMAQEAGIGNIGLCVCPIKARWYDLEGKSLPEHFAFGLNDGPPRQIGTRDQFLDVFGDHVDDIICDDADDKTYRDYLEDWAAKHNRETVFLEPRTFLLRAA